VTVIDPYYLSVDGVVLGTYAHMIEVYRGLDTLAPVRRSPLLAADRHGSVPSFDPEYDEATLPIVITIAPWDADGAVTHAEGMQGHVQDNTDTLKRVFGKRSALDVRRFMPAIGGGTVELQAYAARGRQVIVDGENFKRMFGVDLILPYPFWHELPLISRASNTAHVINVGGTAPVADMVLTFAGDGTLTDDLGHEITITGSAGAVTVDVGAREAYEGGSLAMNRLSLGAGSDGHWMEWPAQTTVTVSSTVGVAVDYYNARH